MTNPHQHLHQRPFERVRVPHPGQSGSEDTKPSSAIIPARYSLVVAGKLNFPQPPQSCRIVTERDTYREELREMANKTAMQVMKVLHRQANPTATTRGTPAQEAKRLNKSRRLALANATAMLSKLNRAAVTETATTIQAMTDDAQVLLDAATGFQELIDDIPNGRQLAA